MVDKINPTNQFHPYHAPDMPPQTGKPVRGGLGGMLDNMNMRGQLDKVRSMAQKNPSLVLGGLAALAIGAGLMRGRR